MWEQMQSNATVARDTQKQTSLAHIDVKRSELVFMDVEGDVDIGFSFALPTGPKMLLQFLRTGCLVPRKICLRNALERKNACDACLVILGGKMEKMEVSCTIQAYE